MSTIKWRTGMSCLAKEGIEPVACVKETKCYLWIKHKDWNGHESGQRCSKDSFWTQFHNTWEEAHAYLLSKAQAKVDSARRRLDSAQSHLNRIQDLRKPPEDAPQEAAA